MVSKFVLNDIEENPDRAVTANNAYKRQLEANQNRAVTADPSAHLQSILKGNSVEVYHPTNIVSAPSTTKNKVQFDDRHPDQIQSGAQRHDNADGYGKLSSNGYTNNNLQNQQISHHDYNKALNFGKPNLDPNDRIDDRNKIMEKLGQFSVDYAENKHALISNSPSLFDKRFVLKDLALRTVENAQQQNKLKKITSPNSIRMNAIPKNQPIK